MNLVYTEEAERLIAHENAQWTAYAEYPLLFEQELDEAIEEIQKQPADAPFVAVLGGLGHDRVLAPIKVAGLPQGRSSS